MRGLLADVNAEGHLRAIASVWTSPTWNWLWSELGFATFCFRDFDLDRDAADADVWEICQREELILVTGNRNSDGATSLEQVIATRSNPRSLPVITVGDMERVLRDGSYRQRVAEDILEYVVDVEVMRGVGRLFVPVSPV